MVVERRWLRATSALLPATSALLLAASGLLTIAAARERWWPACTSGGFDDPQCLTRQDNAYDFVVPTDPWIPVGRAAELSGLATAALALAVGLLPWLLARSRPLAASTASAALSLPLVPVAVTAVVSGHTGVALEAPFLLPAALWWFFGWPFTVIVVLCFVPLLRTPGAARAQQTARGLLAALLCLSTPLSQVLLAPLVVGYHSHDTAPWTEAVGGAVLVVAALALWPAAAHRRGPLGPTRDGSGPRAGVMSRR